MNGGSILDTRSDCHEASTPPGLLLYYRWVLQGKHACRSDPLQTAVRLRLIGLYLRCIKIVDSRKVIKIKKSDRVLTHVFERFSENSKRFGSLQRPRWRGKGKELANSGSIVRLELGGVSGKRGVVPTIVRSQRPWSESWGASPRHRIKGAGSVAIVLQSLTSTQFMGKPSTTRP
jgi:hypothetical protein